jgi:hypothetical protein
MTITGTELVTKDLPGRTGIWGNIIGRGEIVLVYGGTGTGKTQFAMCLSMGLASGTEFLAWKCTQSRVLYVDAELGERSMRLRVNQTFNSFPQFEGRWFELLCMDDASLANGKNSFRRFPQISDRTEWQFWNKLVANYDVIVFDNLAKCAAEDMDARGDNEFRAWHRAWEFLSAWKTRGKTFILIHHANKQGANFAGGQKKQDDSDLTLGLHRLESLGGRDEFHSLEMRFEKVREIGWPDTQPLHLRYFINDNRITWTHQSLDKWTAQQAQFLSGKGLKLPAIAKELKLPAWKVREMLDDASYTNSAEIAATNQQQQQEILDYDDDQLF